MKRVSAKSETRQIHLLTSAISEQSDTARNSATDSLDNRQARFSAIAPGQFRESLWLVLAAVVASVASYKGEFTRAAAHA